MIKISTTWKESVEILSKKSFHASFLKWHVTSKFCQRTYSWKRLSSISCTFSILGQRIPHCGPHLHTEPQWLGQMSRPAGGAVSAHPPWASQGTTQTSVLIILSYYKSPLCNCVRQQHKEPKSLCGLLFIRTSSALWNNTELVPLLIFHAQYLRYLKPRKSVTFNSLDEQEYWALDFSLTKTRVYQVLGTWARCLEFREEGVCWKSVVIGRGGAPTRGAEAKTGSGPTTVTNKIIQQGRRVKDTGSTTQDTIWTRCLSSM